ncbi:MAG: acyl-CoA dehydrogenase family protein [Actinomycetota bacterium]
MHEPTGGTENGSEDLTGSQELTGSEDLTSAVEAILPLVAEHADWANEHRRPHPEVFAALAGAGLLRLIAPVAYGGKGIGPGPFLAMIETLARVDGSTAWTAMTLNEEVGIASSYLPPDTMTELLGDRPDTIVAGAGLPIGRATRVDGGWRIEGRWSFVSGVPVADRVIVGSWIDREHSPASRRACFTLIPADDVTIVDTWHTAGLRGTGSNDVIVDGVVVPDRWAGVTDFRGPTGPNAPYYRLPSGLRFPWPKVGVATGIAEAALDEFRRLAGAKRSSYPPRLLAERPDAQAAMARAEALVGAGRAWAASLADEIWADAERSEPIGPELHARARLAAATAVDGAIGAVETLASAAGTTASRLDGPWPRLLADVRSVGQHFMVGPQQIQTAGRVLLGLRPDDPAF